MADSDRLRWNERYSAEAYDLSPAPWLRAMEVSLREHPPGARALDIACGPGRHAIYLAELGFAVDALDISDVGLAHLNAELERRRLAGQPLAVTPRQVDLERASLPVDAYDLILDAHYLERPLFTAMRHALRPGAGRLIIHTFLFTPGGPITSRLGNPAFALQPGELRRSFADLEIVDLTEDPAREEAHLLARRR